MTLTSEKLKQLLHYDLDTGIFIWRETRGCRCAGDIAGRGQKSIYREIRIDKRLYKAHRLAWLYMTGEWPTKSIDHANGDPADNRFCNLRLATMAQNIANSKLSKANTIGLKGVTPREGMWLARLKGKSVGTFDCPAAAHFAYLIAADKEFGEFARAR